jgi:hypothetical protein
LCRSTISSLLSIPKVCGQDAFSAAAPPATPAIDNNSIILVESRFYVKAFPWRPYIPFGSCVSIAALRFSCLGFLFHNPTAPQAEMKKPYHKTSKLRPKTGPLAKSAYLFGDFI